MRRASPRPPSAILSLLSGRALLPARRSPRELLQIAPRKPAFFSARCGGMAAFCFTCRAILVPRWKFSIRDCLFWRSMARSPPCRIQSTVCHFGATFSPGTVRYRTDCLMDARPPRQPLPSGFAARGVPARPAPTAMHEKAERRTGCPDRRPDRFDATLPRGPET
jgi:hypothetical protein